MLWSTVSNAAFISNNDRNASWPESKALTRCQLAWICGIDQVRDHFKKSSLSVMATPGGRLEPREEARFSQVLSQLIVGNTLKCLWHEGQNWDQSEVCRWPRYYLHHNCMSSRTFLCIQWLQLSWFWHSQDLTLEICIYQVLLNNFCIIKTKCLGVRKSDSQYQKI